MNSGIYRITSKANPDRCYIGSAINLHRRKLDHFKRLRRNEHHSIILQRHFNKYGSNDLEFEIIENCQTDQLLEREQFYIDSEKPYFNVCKIAGRTTGVKQSDETKNKRAEANKSAWANKPLHEIEAHRQHKRDQYRSKLQHRTGQHGLFVIDFTDENTTDRKLLYSYQCILCDRIHKRKWKEPNITKCECMNKRTGCDILSKVRLPKGKRIYTHRLINKPSPYGKGITYCKNSERFRVRLKYKSKPIHVGYYKSIDEAIAGRDEYIRLYMQHTEYKSLSYS